MKFCKQCDNVLHYKEDKERKVLLYACRTCDYEEAAESNLVSRQEVHHSNDRRTHVVQNVAPDPNLPRSNSVTCAYCNYGESAYYQEKDPGTGGTTCIYICCNCGKRWKK